MSQEHISRFDAVSDKYLQDLNTNLRLAGGDSLFFYNLKLDWLVENLSFKPKCILDFGCAVGALTRLLSQRFPEAQVYGYDPAAECINVANSQIQDSEKNLHFFSDLRDLGKQPDLVIASGVFHHIPISEKQNCINDLYRLLIKDGALYVFEHNPMNPVTRIIVAMAAVDKGATLISCKNMKKMFEEAHFNGVRHKYISFFPPYLKELLPLEKKLTKFPMAAQYFVTGNK